MKKKRWMQYIQWRHHFTQEVKRSHLIQLSKGRYVGLIYKAISYIDPKTNKYCKRENSMSKDAKLKLKFFARVVELTSDVK